MKKKVQSVAFPHYYPVLIDVSSLKCLVVGGGSVALRKIQGLLEYNAEVTVIAPELHKEIESLVKSKAVKAIQKPYAKGDAKDYGLVFSAVDDLEVPKMVKKDCDEAGILLNAADIPEMCHFILPATIRKGPMTISVASQGKAPFLVKYMRDKLNELLPANMEKIANLAAEFRERVIADYRFNDHEKKKEIFRKFNRINWDYILTSEGEKEAQRQMNELFK